MRTAQLRSSARSDHERGSAISAATFARLMMRPPVAHVEHDRVVPNPRGWRGTRPREYPATTHQPQRSHETPRDQRPERRRRAPRFTTGPRPGPSPATSPFTPAHQPFEQRESSPPRTEFRPPTSRLVSELDGTHRHDDDPQPGRKSTGLTSVAGWSSLVARWAHNPKVAGSNPAPATNRDQLNPLETEGFWFSGVNAPYPRPTEDNPTRSP